MPLDPLSNEDKKNTYIGGSTPADYSTDPYRNAPDIKDIPKKMGQALGKSIYNMVNGSRTPTPSTPPSTYDDQSIPGAPTSIRGNNDVGADWGDGSQYTSGATYNTNGQQQNPYEMINEDNPFISGSLRTKQPTNPDEMPITYTQDEWGDTKATIMDQQGGVGSISYEGDPRSKGGSITYTNMFSNALKEQQAKEAAAAAAQQQATPASSVRSRIDALQKQLDKSRSIFDRRGHTLQEYRKAAALRKDLRQQIQDLQGVEQQEMKGQQAMDLAALQGQFGLQEAGISNANKNAITPYQQYQIMRQGQQDQRQAVQDEYQKTKDTQAAATAAESSRSKELADIAAQRSEYINNPDKRAGIASGLDTAVRARHADTLAKFQNGTATQADFDRIMQDPQAVQLMTLSQELLSQTQDEGNWDFFDWGKKDEVPYELRSDPYSMGSWQRDGGDLKFNTPSKYSGDFNAADLSYSDIPEGQRGMIDLALLLGQYQRGNTKPQQSLRQQQGK